MDEQKLKVYGGIVTFTGRPDLENRSMRRAKVDITLIDDTNPRLSDPKITFEFRLPIGDELTIADAEALVVRTAAQHLKEIADQIINTPAVNVLRPPPELQP